VWTGAENLAPTGIRSQTNFRFLRGVEGGLKDVGTQRVAEGLTPLIHNLGNRRTGQPHSQLF
jgi:hypothetical protein